MSFDLSTAQPDQDNSDKGFDVNSAQPVQDQTVSLADKNMSISAPAGMPDHHIVNAVRDSVYGNDQQPTIPPEGKETFIQGIGDRLQHGFATGMDNILKVTGADKNQFIKNNFELTPQEEQAFGGKPEQENNPYKQFADHFADGVGGLLSTLPVFQIAGEATVGTIATAIPSVVGGVLSQIPRFAIGAGEFGAAQGAEKQAGEGAAIQTLGGVQGAAEGLFWNTLYGNSGRGLALFPKMVGINIANTAYDALKQNRLPTSKELYMSAADGLAYASVFAALPHLQANAANETERTSLSDIGNAIQDAVKAKDVDKTQAALDEIQNHPGITPETKQVVSDIFTKVKIATEEQSRQLLGKLPEETITTEEKQQEQEGVQEKPQENVWPPTLPEGFKQEGENANSGGEIIKEGSEQTPGLVGQEKEGNDLRSSSQAGVETKQGKEINPILQEVIKRGGIDPDKAKDAGFDKQSFKEMGIGKVLKQGGQGIDDLAGQLQSEHLLAIKDNESPSETLYRALRGDNSAWLVGHEEGGESKGKDVISNNPADYKTPEEYIATKGQPVYHGTDAKFDKFDHSKTGGVGFYFTSDKSDAARHGENVKEAYLDIKNPAPDKSVEDAYARASGGNPRKMAHEELMSEGYDGIIRPGETIAFSPDQIKTKEDLQNEWEQAKANPESGTVDVSMLPFVNSLSEKVENVNDFLKESQKEVPQAKNFQQGMYMLDGANGADQIRANKFLESMRVNNVLTPEERVGLHDFMDNIDAKRPQDVKLNPNQEAVFEQLAKLQQASNEAFNKVRGAGVPTEDLHLTRMVEGTGNIFEKIKSGIQNISGSILRKTAPEFQERVMKAITDAEGNRRVVAVKGGQVTAFDKGNSEDMGPIKRNLPDPVTEAYDKQVMDKLGALAKSLGIKHERVVAIPRKRAMGLSLTGQNKVITEAATPEAVLLHEIGHQIDDKYDLQRKFVDQKVSDYKGLEKLQVGEMKRELRDLVDLKYETNPDVVKNFKTYVRKGPEKIAAMFEALVQAPDRFKEVAPNLYEKFTSFLASKPELAPILDIKRSMEITQNKVGEVNHPGVFTDKNGKDWQLGQATVKEIEANTDLKYYKDPIVQVLDSYLRLRRVERAVDFLESVKEDPDFEKVAMRFDAGGSIPEGWKPTQLPQFKGYALDPKVADVMDSFQKQMLDRKDPFNLLMGINRFVRVNMFLNPLVHPANVGTSWAYARGVSRWFVPQAYGRLYGAIVKSITAVKDLNGDYQKVLEDGGNLMSADVRLAPLRDLIEQKITSELQENEPLRDNIAKALGYLNPANLVKGYQKFNETAAWVANDFFTLTHIYEKEAEGMESQKAIQDASKWIPDYRIPSRVLGSKAVADTLKDPRFTMFSGYHYGILKSIGNGIKGILPNSLSVAERAEALDKLAALALINCVVYPALDKLFQQITGNKDTTLRRSGPAAQVDNTYQMLKGKMPWQWWAMSTITPSPVLKSAVELGTNNIIGTKKDIFHPEDTLEEKVGDLGKYAKEQLGVGRLSEQVSEGKKTIPETLENVAGIRTPHFTAHTDAEQEAMNIKFESPNNKSMTDEEQKSAQARYNLEDQYAKDKNPSILKDAIANKQISQYQANQIKKYAKEEPIIRLTRGFDTKQLESVYDKGNADEKKLLLPVIEKNLQSQIRKTFGPQKDELIAKLEKYRGAKK